MTDGDALYAAILSNPACDTARLVYADWLEENGQSLRAKIVRMGVAHPEKEIVVDRWEAWTPVKGGWRFIASRALRLPGLTACLRPEFPAFETFPEPRARWHMARGFVWRVKMRWGHWKLMGQDLVDRYPITRVGLWFDYTDPEDVEILRKRHMRPFLEKCRARWRGVSFTHG